MMLNVAGFKISKFPIRRVYKVRESLEANTFRITLVIMAMLVAIACKRII